VGDDVTPSWLTYYLGVADTPLVRAIGARWMISAVSRIHTPGNQADCCLVLEGKTGLGKSSTFRILGAPWYTADVAALNTKDAKEQMAGVWIVELDELDAISRVAEWTSVISFVSRSVDRFRFSYGRRVVKHDRQCVFGATTERDNWIPNLAGKRRWWPVRCTAIDRDSLRRDRDQLWAEALVRYQAGEVWYLHEQRLLDEAQSEQDTRAETDPWEDDILQYVNGFRSVSTTAVLVSGIHLPLDRCGKAETMRVGSVLRKHGWTRKLVREMVGTKTAPRWRFVNPTIKATNDC
jgi:putative DNA primase/helicase